MPAPRQWLWFVGLWAAGVGVTALVGYAIKLWLEVTRLSIPRYARDDSYVVRRSGRQLKAIGLAVPLSRREARSSRPTHSLAVST